MKKPKILFRVGNMRGGGAEKVLIRYLNNFDRAKIEVGVLMHQFLGVYANKVPNDVKVYYLETGPEFIQQQGILRKVVKEYEKNRGRFLKNRPEIIYSKIIKDSYDVEVAFLHDIIPFTVKSPINKKIGWIRTDLKSADYITKKCKQKIVDGSYLIDKVICVSKDSKNKFLNMGANQKNIEVLYNPIDTKGIYNKANIIEHQFNNNLINIVAIGRLTHAKRFDKLIDSAKMLIDRNTKNFKISIIGNGELKNELEKQIKRLDLSNYIELLGFHENPYPLLKASDIYVMSSEREGLPGTICEAMVLHKPIVSTKVGGAVELLQKDKLGILVDHKVLDISTALNQLINNKELREDYSNKLKNTNFPFDFDETISRMTDTILEVL